MADFPDLTRLTSSWTKYDSVQVIDVINSEEELKLYIAKEKSIDEPTLRHFLGINNINDELPKLWAEIQKYPDQKRLFALMAAIFTHHFSISDFAEFSTGDMKGVFVMDQGKQYTNLRSALVEAGAASNSYRRKEEVPYDLSILYENGEVGVLFKQLLEQRLKSIGWDGNHFYDVAAHFEFEKVLSITKEQFKDWTEGKSLSGTTLGLQLVKLKKYQATTGYKVNQWLNEWDDINYSKDEMREKPQPFFIMFKIDARLLKRISEVHRRNNSPEKTETDLAVQRDLKVSRSKEIHNYIHGGFPWSTISEAQQISEDYKELKMPGILPTAIIANILGPGSERGNNTLDAADEIKITGLDTDFPTLTIPDNAFNEEWNPKLKPLEIIDGQHRLWAFDERETLEGNYELPVIAYFNLDRAWQAYLFYTINIKPTKINTSLGYDLYPLLRTQKWLENSKDGLLFYRENRAQELVEALFTYKESPWRGRIKMLGEGEANISQAAFVKALSSSFLKKSGSTTARGMGGLFSEIIENNSKKQVLNWNRSQQAAFLIILWDIIRERLALFLDAEQEVLANEPVWAKQIRIQEDGELSDTLNHPAFISKNSFLSRDQGVRGICMFANDVFYAIAGSEHWDLNKDLTWDEDLDDKTILPESIDKAIKDFKKHKLYNLMLDFGDEVIKLDWRTTSADFSDDAAKRDKQMRYKGGSGYSEVWRDLIDLFVNIKNTDLQAAAIKVSAFKN